MAAWAHANYVRRIIWSKVRFAQWLHMMCFRVKSSAAQLKPVAMAHLALASMNRLDPPRKLCVSKHTIDPCENASRRLTHISCFDCLHERRQTRTGTAGPRFY